ncbi:MAG: GTPase HflX [Clostridiales bacterium]|nr:GTPase HflX [Clostridiales bacterium]
MFKIKEDGAVTEREGHNAILVGLGTGEDMSRSMEELASLAEAAGLEVLGEMVQNADKIHASTYIGSGKLEELAEMCGNMQAGLVVFNDELSGMQQRNIEEVCGVPVIDRTVLILDIFAQRASSLEGKLQVEMAQLEYRLPRLSGLGKALSRLGGGIGTRGPGEKKLETDRRHIRRRISAIKKELEEVKANRSVQRVRREKSGIPVAALVGYTNSGKSSIMNHLMSMEERDDKMVFEKDMLFATLDTAQRLVTFSDGRSFVLIDTVGFVSKLPTALVDAFKATLEELEYADILIHVVDSSYEDCGFQMEVTRGLMKELGIDEKPVLTAFNKSDLIAPKYKENLLLLHGRDGVAISCRTGEGFEEFLKAVKDMLFMDLKVVELLIPYTRGDVVSALLEGSRALQTRYDEDGTYIKAELGEADRGRFKDYIIN